METIERYLEQNFLWRRTYLRNHYVRIWYEMKQEFEQHQQSALPKIWCSYGASLLLKTGMLRYAIDLAFETEVCDRAMLHINDALPDLNLFLLTHLHGDHYDPEVIQLIARRKRTTFILPEPVMSRVIEETGLREDQILPIREGECRQFAGGTIEAYQVPHGGVKCNFGYLLETEGKRIVFSSDIRDYSTGWLPNLGNVDLLCLNLWLGRDQGLKFSLHVVEEACQFIASIRPRRVLFYHLYEVSRTPENGWTYVHAGLVQDRLLTLVPEIRCYAPYWGEGVTI